MAEGSKVKKGFFSYLLVFILMIVAFFAVCVVIMIFNPGKSILGFKYNSNHSVNEVVATTDEGHQELNLYETHYDVIEIDAGIANVFVESNDGDGKDCILITNNIRSFSRANEENVFNYSVLVEDGTLKVKVNATKGFLNFSDDISVKVHIAMRSEDVEVFKNTKFVIKTTTGDVNIGGTRNPGHSQNVAVGGLDVETEFGNIVITDHANGFKVDGRDLYEFNSGIKLKTKRGNVNLLPCSSGSTSAGINQPAIPNVLKVNGEGLDVEVGSGKLKLGNYIGKIKVSAQNTTVEIDKIKGSLDVLLTSSLLNIDTIDGNVDFSEGNDVMDSNHVKINKVTGFVNIPDGRSSNIDIYDVGGEINIHTTSGNVNLGSEDALINHTTYVETEKGNINIYFSGDEYSRVLKTQQGKITTNFSEVIVSGNKNQFTSEKNSITVNFNKNSKIKFKFSKATSDDEFDLSKVSFDITNGKKIEDNPYFYNATGAVFATFELSTDNAIILDLI